MSIKTLIKKTMINVNEAAHKAKEKVRDKSEFVGERVYGFEQDDI